MRRAERRGKERKEEKNRSYKGRDKTLRYLIVLSLRVGDFDRRARQVDSRNSRDDRCVPKISFWGTQEHLEKIVCFRNNKRKPEEFECTRNKKIISPVLRIGWESR